MSVSDNALEGSVICRRVNRTKIVAEVAAGRHVRVTKDVQKQEVGCKIRLIMVIEQRQQEELSDIKIM